LLTFGSHIILVAISINFALSHEIRYPHYTGYIIFCIFSLLMQVRLYGYFEEL